MESRQAEFGVIVWCPVSWFKQSLTHKMVESALAYPLSSIGWSVLVPRLVLEATVQ